MDAHGEDTMTARPDSWEGLFRLHGEGEIPADFMGPPDRDQGTHDRDPFADWTE
jgi:antitoxin VapB